jgi:hypothetical protein
MTTSMYDHTKSFVSQFQQLKKLCANSPDGLDRLCQLNSNARVLVSSLFTNAYLLQTVFGKSPRLYVKQVHENFPELWGEYETVWSTEVWSARLLLNLDDPDQLSITPKEDRTEEEQINDDHAGIYIEDFDPQWHVLSEAIVNLIRYCRDRILYAEVPEAVATLQLGVTAWDFLESMGFSIEEASRRYARMPKVYTPKHVSDHGTSERQSLFRLLDETVRAYYFGAPLAALSMCRSILELVLGRYYVSANASDRLSDMIKVAERQHPWLRQENLRAKKDAANAVLHGTVHRGRRQARTLPENIDEEVRNFIFTLKRMIERAPQPTS